MIIRDMLAKRCLVETLRQESIRWEHWASAKIFPLLDGTHHMKLVLYFELMHEATGDSTYQENAKAVQLLINAKVGLLYLNRNICTLYTVLWILVLKISYHNILRVRIVSGRNGSFLT